VARARAKLQLAAATRDYMRKSIPLIDQNNSFSTLQFTQHIHNAVYPCLQHAQAACRARLPRPAAREGPAPPVLAQDEVSRSCSYPRERSIQRYTNANNVAEGGALRFVLVVLKKKHPQHD
jgi:hypothetical protein